MKNEINQDYSGLFDAPALINGDSYATVLSMFTSKDAWREELSHPFTVGNKAIATDGHSMAFCDKALVPEIGPAPSERISDATLAHIQRERNQAIKVYISEFKEVLAAAPTTDGYNLIKSDIECTACSGEGEVEYVFKHNGNSWEHEAECPVCDGHGIEGGVKSIPTGKKVFKQHYTGWVGVSLFQAQYLAKIVKVAHLLGEDHFTIVHQSEETKPTIFQIGPIGVLMMPVYKADEDYVVFDLSQLAA